MPRRPFQRRRLPRLLLPLACERSRPRLPLPSRSRQLPRQPSHSNRSALTCARRSTHQARPGTKLLATYDLATKELTVASGTRQARKTSTNGTRLCEPRAADHTAETPLGELVVQAAAADQPPAPSHNLLAGRPGLLQPASMFGPRTALRVGQPRCDHRTRHGQTGRHRGQTTSRPAPQ